MSKRLFKRKKYKERMRRRSVDQVAKNRRRSLSIKSTQSPSKLRKRKRRVKQLRAPNNFSMIQNPTETTRFLNSLIEASHKFNLEIDLASVKTMTYESPGLLLAHIKKAIENGANLQGSFPKATKPKLIFEKSGIFNFLTSNAEIETSSDGLITFRENKQILNDEAAVLCRLASQKITGEGRPIRAAYGILVDLMANTHNHAALDDEGTELWWATVATDQEARKAFFTFIDMGVGIFESLPKTRPQWYRQVKERPRTALLQDLLAGKIPSRTGKTNRGRGIPGLVKRLKQGAITQLKLISNNVNADIESEKAEIMQTNFKGTLVYWEVSL